MSSAAHRPTVGVNLLNFGPHGGREIIEAAVGLERAGIDRVNLTDHVVMGPDTSAYEWGAFPTDPDSPWFEPLTMLAMIGARTERVRLGTGIVIAALRGPAVLAKTVATLDVLTGGRVDLGVGTGWQAKEYEACGLDFARRGQLLDDTLETCRALWSHAPVGVELPSVSFGDVYCSPRPVGRIPVWVSGSASRPVVERLARFGDGWIPIMNLDDAGLRAGVDRIARAFEDHGRDPATLEVRGRLTVSRDDAGRLDPGATVARAEALCRAGATDLMVSHPMLGSDPAAVEEVASALVGALADR